MPKTMLCDPLSLIPSLSIIYLNHKALTVKFRQQFVDALKRLCPLGRRV